MSKGGSQSTEVSVPKYIEDAARSNLSRASDIANMDYVPQYGPTVAAFSPMQELAMQNTMDTANAFGIGDSSMSRQDILGGMDAPTEYAGGVRGYSSMPIFKGMMDEFQADRPGQFDYRNSFFIDPVTGEAGSRATSQAPALEPAPPQGVGLGTPISGGNDGGSSNLDEIMAMARASRDSTRAGGSGMTPANNYVAPPKPKYKNFKDMIDGGGPGAAGGTPQNIFTRGNR
tara:strand:- start:1124 stop:1813 length:690 start_codon:yes stop_codon:yes gene_type:complete